MVPIISMKMLYRQWFRTFYYHSTRIHNGSRIDPAAATSYGPAALQERTPRRMSVSRRVVFALPLIVAASARAEAWPTKPLRLVVPYPAGGPTDVLARALAAKM